MKIVDKWDFSSVIGDDLDKQIEKERIEIESFVEGFVSRWRERTDYLEKPEVLREALDELENFKTNLSFAGNVGYYLSMMRYRDQTDEDIKAKLSLMEDFSTEMSNKLTFFGLNIAKISEDKQKDFLEFEGLASYKHYLERKFRASKYYLSEEVENVLSLKSGPAYEDWVSMTNELLSKEEREVFTGERNELKTFSEIQGMLDNPHKKVRDSCAAAFNDILEKYSDVATAEINAVFRDKKVNDKLRGFSRSDESRVVSDDIDFDFVDGLVSAVKKRYSLTRKYYELKARLLGQDKLEYHERNVPYGKVKKEISYEEGVEIVHGSFDKLDSDFGKIFKDFVEGGNIDVYPAKGKWNGAFCAWALKTHPVRILLNYMNRPYDVMVLAHESGHGVNHELMKEVNSFNYSVPMVVAEVASTFAESVVFEDLLNKVDSEEEKLSMLMAKLNNDLSSIVRQVACYSFETELHKEYRKKGNLSKEEIGRIFQKNMGDYMGDFVEQSEGAQNWWVYWSHIRDFFYVYSYASGTLISQTLFSKVKENPDFINNVKEFLSTGRSKSPKQCFEDMGLETNEGLWNEGLDNLEKLMDKTWRLAEKLGKI